MRFFASFGWIGSLTRNYYRVLADKLNFLPRNNKILTFSEQAKPAHPPKYYNRNNFGTFGIYYNVIHKADSCAVAGAYYLLVSKVGKAAIHTIASVRILLIYM